MNLPVFLFLSIIFYACWAYEEKEDLTIRISDGKILGRYITSESGRSVSAFIGIPFAAPPIGDLRFKAPQKAIPWSETLSVQSERPKCPQIDNVFSGSTSYQGEEDCLYLNVYVPETGSDAKLDVLVWFHGGGFTISHGGPSSYAPDYLLDHDVILVSGNYRLGALGFLSTEDEYCPGNFGLKDQTFLLQWVQDNIEYFGSDRNSVTIWGESAGAVAIMFHMMVPISHGLFHKAICDSPRPAEPAPTGVAKQQAIRFAELFNCPIDDGTEEIVKCLRNVSPEDMVHASNGAFPIVVESFESDEDAFIGERNLEDLFSNSVEIPWLLGINSEEGLLSMANVLSNSALLDNLISTWDAFLPSTFGYDHLSPVKIEEITRKINLFYFGNETTPTNRLDRNNLVDLFTDHRLTVVETVKQRLGHSNHGSTYIYLYTHKGTSSYSTATEFYGTSHIDDLISLFPMRKTSTFYSAIPTEQDKALTKVMSRMWTDFARTGNPTPDTSTTLIWSIAANFPLNYLQIGNEHGKLDNQILQPRTGLHPARANFWIELREEYRISP